MSEQSGETPQPRTGVVERTESHVQCECIIQPCRHAPDFYRVVVEWGAWDERGCFLGTFDRKRDAVAALSGSSTQAASDA